MKDEPKNNNTDNQDDNHIKKTSKKDEHLYQRWKDPANNNMGNDISGDMKVANANGNLEGGKDKRWHMDEEE